MVVDDVGDGQAVHGGPVETAVHHALSNGSPLAISKRGALVAGTDAGITPIKPSRSCRGPPCTRDLAPPAHASARLAAPRMMTRMQDEHELPNSGQAGDADRRAAAGGDEQEVAASSEGGDGSGRPARLDPDVRASLAEFADGYPEISERLFGNDPWFGINPIEPRTV